MDGRGFEYMRFPNYTSIEEIHELTFLVIDCELSRVLGQYHYALNLVFYDPECPTICRARSLDLHKS